LRKFKPTELQHGRAAVLIMWIEIAKNTWAEAKDEEEAERIRAKYKGYKKKQGDLTSRHFIVNYIEETNFIK